MANTIALAQKYTAILDETIVKEGLTAMLNADTSLLNFIGANTVKFPKMTVDGLANTDRNGNFTKGNVSLSYETHVLSVDRNRIFGVDVMDNEETQGVAFGMLASEFIRTKVIPELDAYRFAKLYAKAGTKVEADLTSATVLTALNTAIAKFDDDEVPMENRQLFVSVETASLIEEVNGFDKSVNANLPTANVGFRVQSYKGIPVMVVPKGRFYTSIKLNDGTTTGEEAGGFVVTPTTGKSLNFILAHTPSVKGGVVKHNPLNIISASVNQTSDQDLFKYRVYHDFFVLDNKTKALYAHNKTTVTA